MVPHSSRKWKIAAKYKSSNSYIHSSLSLSLSIRNGFICSSQASSLSLSEFGICVLLGASQFLSNWNLVICSVNSSLGWKSSSLFVQSGASSTCATLRGSMASSKRKCAQKKVSVTCSSSSSSSGMLLFPLVFFFFLKKCIYFFGFCGSFSVNLKWFILQSCFLAL